MSAEPYELAPREAKTLTLVKAIIVEDSEDDLLLLLRALKKGGIEVIYTRVETRDALQEALADQTWQMVISDHAMPRFSAPEALEVLKESGRDLPFIIVSGTIGEEIAVEAMKAGAHDYIMKDNLSRLAPAVQRELRDAVVREQHNRYRQQLEYMSLHDQMTGLYNRVYFENELVRLEGGRDYPILILSADLDGLKLINDSLGPKVGDAAIKTCAELLGKPLRKGDLLARIGGDEFVAILPRSGDLYGPELADMVRAEVEAYNEANEHLPLSISVGYALATGPHTPLGDIFKEATAMMNLDKLNRSESVRSQVVNSLLAALSERDYISGGHAERLENLCLTMGEIIGLDRHRLASLAMVAQVHDLGKVGIPDHILFKDRGLTEEEWKIMRLHPEKGYRIALASPELEPVAELILRHHEKWDGTGYPLGLKGEEIPVECRILSIVDAFDAMTNDRPYRAALSREEALEEIARSSGTQFDPQLVKIFMSIV